jgi:hypothetical protein
MGHQLIFRFALYALCISSGFGISAQNSKDKPITVQYVRLPEQKLPDNYNTYSVEVVGSNTTTGGLNADQLAASVTMDGFKRVSGLDGNHGHLRIYINTGYTDMGRAESKSETRTSKDKDGKETKTTYYWYNVPFTTSPTYRLLDPEGNILGRGGLPQSTAIKSKEYTSASLRSKEYTTIVNAMRKNFASQAARDITSSAREHASKQFDFNHVKEYPQFFLVTKWPSEDAYEKHFEKTKQIFESASAVTPSNELRSKLAAAIEFWDTDAKKNPGDDKKLKKVYYAANMNLALVSFYTDDFEAAKAHLRDIIKSEEKDRVADKFLERIAGLEKAMAFHDIHTMHYMRDLSNALPPSAVKAIEEEQAELEAKNNASAGTIIINGESISGSFMQSKDAGDLIFGEGGNTTFMVDSGSELKEYDVTAADVSAFSIGERSFVKLPFTPCAKGKSQHSTQILEEVYTSERIKLYKYYPSTGAMSDDKVEFAFQKASQAQPLSVYATEFLLWEKGIAKYFEDCSDLSTMSAGGSIKMEQEDLIKAARIYSELCQ